ncbi:MAG: hypothetical protein KR126chlam1_00199 [Chlamydiae bacterium]|nr:hypothetical protein [Chlamydiota bacterium]
MKDKTRQLIPILVLIVFIFAAYLANAHHFFTLEKIRLEQEKLLSFVSAHPVLSPCIYLAVYIISVCLIIPDSIILILLGGFIFPLPLAILYAIFCETVGATIIFAIFNKTFGRSLILKEHSILRKMRKNFKRNYTSYLLFLRISTVVPFWITNAAAAYFRVPYKTFIWTTFVGVIPLIALVADAGSNLSHLFATGKIHKISDVFNLQMKLALLGIALLAILPLLYKAFIKRKKKRWK